MKAASEAIGKNDAYIQQYIKRRKPVWLPEQVRIDLVRLYGTEEEQLRPHRKRIDGDPSQRKNHLMTPDGLVELIRIWSSLSEERRTIALGLLRSLTPQCTRDQKHHQ